MAQGIRTNGDVQSVPGWIRAEMKDVFSGASILLVEDDNDIRELMETLLRLAGFDPTVCSSAEVALEQLREQPFDLVLTDYALPNRTGGWLLQQARAEGLLDATPALVVTAHPDPPDVDGFEIICKPFDLDDLVERIKLRLAGQTSGRKARRAPGGGSKKDDGGNGHDGARNCPDPVELILYVSPDSPTSATAMEKIKQVVERFQSYPVKLTICELSQSSEPAPPEAVLLTPAMLDRAPGPRTFILGHITNPDVVMELLRACGEEVA
jgi:CheY-like chemotaxis protein